jgi:DNA-binding XRE family transcriptional regulator
LCGILHINLNFLERAITLVSIEHIGEVVQVEMTARRALPKSFKPGTYALPGLARVRKERGYSIRKLAERAEVTPDTVWRLETCKRGAEPKTRRKLAYALRTTVRELRTPNEEVDGK